MVGRFVFRLKFCVGEYGSSFMSWLSIKKMIVISPLYFDFPRDNAAHNH